MSSITIGKPTLKIEGKTARVSSMISHERELWFEFPSDYKNDIITESADGFLVALLPLAISKGVDIKVEGAISSKLHYNLSAYFIEIYNSILLKTKKINITSEKLTTKNFGAHDVYTGFSAGIDSFATIIDHSNNNVPPEYVVTRFLFNDVGGHGVGESGETVFQQRYDRLKDAAKVWEKPLIPVKSNLDDFLDISFHFTHTLRNAAVALLLQKSCAKFIYSSGYHYNDIAVHNADAIARADALLVNLLSTETTECISAGGQYTRFMKTEIVASSPKAYKNLDVCLMPLDATKTNCSKCCKCLRTLLSLEVMGALNKFKDCFDLSVYQKYKWLYLCTVISNKNTYMDEIREGMKTYNYGVPISARVFSYIMPSKVIELMLVLSTWAQTKNPIRILWFAITHFPDAIQRVKKRLDKNIPK